MEGLTSKQAKQFLKKYGPNELVRKKEFSALKLFLSQFKSPLIYILVFAGLVTLFLRDFTDTIVIFAAVFINTSLGFYQEFKAQKSLQALKSLLAPKAKVIRDGEQKTIDAWHLVPGDLVVLAIGDRVPADGALVEETDLTVNEAILTGESMPVTKSQKSKVLPAGRHGKSQNLVFMGTIVVAGIGKMVVTKTGMETEMGRIGKVVGEVEEEKTPLQEQIAGLARLLAVVVGLITGLIFILGEFRGYEPVEIFTISVAVAVAAIPEGLLVTMTVILALGMQRILKRKAIVRKLLAAETLGCVSVICADKTGTLTEGNLKVVEADFTDSDLGVRAAVLCNDMRDPLEAAMMEWTQKKLKVKSEELKVEYPRIDEIPFSSETKIKATLHQNKFGSGQALLFVSGAPEVVVSKCQMSNDKFQIWNKKFEDYGKKGYRLVGFAYKEIKNSKLEIQNSDLKDLVWLGILIYEDPIREGVREALEECQCAGIKVKVITGDYLPTALAVLEKLGLDGRKHAITGDELEKMSLKELEKKVENIVLFARTNPQQKLKIVQALKNNGEVVAMMGDGVNDAPALKQADIGIVVNEASDVAKETADIVLLDSNFATIVYAVEEGRTIFENIKKVVLFLLADGFCEIILVGGALLLGMPVPVTAAQILWVNLAEDTFPAMALAFEKEGKDIMTEKPRKREAPVLDLEMKVLIFVIGVITDVFLLVLFVLLTKGLFDLHHIQTVMFVALGIDSIFMAFACRSFRKTIFQKGLFANPTLIYCVLLALAILAAAVYLPPLQFLLRTHALGLTEWLFLLGLGVFNLLAIELTKIAFLAYGRMKKR